MSLNEDIVSLVPVSNNTDLSNLLVSWVGTISYYETIRKHLEEKYRSPLHLHEAHLQTINHINSIIKELKVIAQTTQRLNKKEELIQELIKSIEQSYDTSITNKTQYEIDKEIENTFLNTKIDSYTEMSNSVELTCKSLIEKMLLSFSEEVEPISKKSNDNFFTIPKNINILGKELIPKELYPSIYINYMSVVNLPLPALEAFIYMDSQLSDWQFNPTQYKLWLSSMCGRVLAYYTIIGEQEKVTKIISRLNKS